MLKHSLAVVHKITVKLLHPIFVISPNVTGTIRYLIASLQTLA